MDKDDAFWERVQKSDSCWEVPGYRNSHGYGQLTRNGKRWRAHRYAWTLENGPIPQGFCVLHRCDNPPCVRIDHLFLGTHQDNMNDMAKKGRGRSGSAGLGEKHPRAKVTAADVETIRTRYQNGETQTAIAKDYPIGRTAVNMIVTRRNWT